MRCFVKCSSSALQSAKASGLFRERLLMMDVVAADVHDRQLLEESHFAYTAIRSAYRQAYAGV